MNPESVPPSAERRLPSPDGLWLIWQLADSAFPTGGFAHSWGLEAAWQTGEVPGADALRRFVSDSLTQAGRGGLPLLTAAHGDPSRLRELDALADAFLTNVVANRASRVQGRAFLTTCSRIWAAEMAGLMEISASNLHGHAAPLIGAALRAIGVPLDVAQRLLLFNTLRGILAAAVRLGLVGSYDAQRLQVDRAAVLDDVLERCAALDAAELAQTAPILDLLQASHDRLYSRLFQS
jgi:urease accessory protein